MYSKVNKYYDTAAGNIVLAEVDAVWDSTHILNPLVLGCLFAPALGSNYDDRTGRQVYIKAIRIWYSVHTPPGVTTGPPPAQRPFRLVLVMDKKTNGVTIDPGEVLQASVPVKAIVSMQNIDFFGKYEILCDERKNMPPYSIGAADDPLPMTNDTCWAGTSLTGELFYKFDKPKIVNFSDDTGTISDIVDNSFHLFGGVDEYPSTIFVDPAPPVIDYQCRVYFCE